ncbi:MAG TPA: PEP/pyruvate-binding domain-containing protein [Candidatus Tectomicrobia bacterium]|nr:PEP/pyruvate-binding domain-containing protein [Candidatus Tectomicrobia bacterium]
MEVLWLGHSDCHDVHRVGAKAANLSRLAACYRIPPGFCVSAEAYSRWVAFTNSSRPASPAQAISRPLYNALASAYRSLAAMCGVSDPKVAVRSSAVEEDGATRSFAGQYETYLNIVGVDAVAEAVVRCWTSVRTDRVLAYHRELGMTIEGVRLAVLVQQLIPADTSAVVFSANPVTGSRDEVVINAGWGLGESIVSGTVTPDSYVIRKSDLAVVSCDIAEKRRMTVLTHEGTQEVPVPRGQQRSPSIDDTQVVELARLGMALEVAMGWPVDIECAYQGRNLYLLQCRPITTLDAR